MTARNAAGLLNFDRRSVISPGIRRRVFEDLDIIYAPFRVLIFSEPQKIPMRSQTRGSAVSVQAQKLRDAVQSIRR